MIQFIKKNLSISVRMQSLLLLVISLFVLFSCDVTETNDEGLNDTSTTPFFSYKINSNELVNVNCEKIRFVSSEGGNHVQELFGQSESINSTFSFAFYGSSTIMDTLRIGDYPLIAYTGYSSKVPMHFSLKVPRTKGGRDYYFTIESPSSGYKHSVESIEKGGLENNLRVYFIRGSYKLRAINIVDEEEVDISGNYYFKLLTINE